MTGGPTGFVQRARGDLTLRREADVMGLTAGNDHTPPSRLDVLTLVWGTTLGLALTHWFALSFSVRLVPDPRFTYSPWQLLGPQIAMAVLVAIAASIVVLLIPRDFDRLGARITAALFLALLVGVESRVSGSSRRVAWTTGGVALVIAVTIATVKWLAG